MTQNSSAQTLRLIAESRFPGTREVFNDFSTTDFGGADKARIAYSCRHGAEERAVCAILHATSLYIPCVLIPSGIVWGLQRSRSQFLAVQSLQTLMHQLVVFLGQLAGFGLFMFGFMVAISSGLGVAMILGLGAIFFFQMVFPCVVCGQPFASYGGMNSAIRYWAGWQSVGPVNSPSMSRRVPRARGTPQRTQIARPCWRR